MKKFTLIALFALSVNASAAVVGPDSSFDEIKAAGLVASFPTIMFQTEGVTVDELCIDGDMVRPVNPNKTTCAKYDTRGDHFNCIEYVTTYLSTPVNYQEQVCVLWDNSNPNRVPNCVAYELVNKTYAKNYEVSIYVNKPRAGLVELFTKTYTIPACQN